MEQNRNVLTKLFFDEAICFHDFPENFFSVWFFSSATHGKGYEVFFDQTLFLQSPNGINLKSKATPRDCLQKYIYLWCLFNISWESRWGKLMRSNSHKINFVSRRWSPGRLFLLVIVSVVYTSMGFHPGSNNIPNFRVAASLWLNIWMFNWR